MEALLQGMKKFRRKNVLKIIFANICLVATSAFIILIWYNFQPEFLSTKAGIILVIAAMAMYLVFYNRMFPLLRPVEAGVRASEYLKQLTELKKRQMFQQVTVLNLYFLILSAGLCLYLFEYTTRMSALGATLAYGSTLLWIALNWFVLRPRMLKKQRKEIDTLIAKFEGISAQIKLEEQ